MTIYMDTNRSLNVIW